jgi:hypothetical protein
MDSIHDVDGEPDHEIELLYRRKKTEKKKKNTKEKENATTLIATGADLIS